MAKHKKEHCFSNIIKEGLSYLSQLANISPQIAESTERVMKNINYGTIPMEKRILRKISSLLIIMFGGIFLIFALFFYLKEFLGWSNTISYFSIGIIILVIGLILRINESNK